MKKFLIAATASVALLGASASVTTASAADYHNNPFGLLLGAAAGGLVGSQIGQGQGRIVATAAGTFIGAMIGANVSSSNHGSSSYTRTVYRSPRQIYAPRPVQYRGYDRSNTTVYVDNRTYVTNNTTTVTQVNRSYTDHRNPYASHWHR